MLVGSLIFPAKRITASETHKLVVSRRQTRTFACEFGSTRQPHTVTHRFPNDSCDDCKSSMSVGSKQRSPWAKVYRLSIWINRSGNIPLLGHYPLKISFSSGAFPKQNVLLYYLCHYYGIIIRLVFHRHSTRHYSTKGEICRIHRMYAPRHRRFATGLVVHGEVQHFAQSSAANSKNN